MKEFEYLKKYFKERQQEYNQNDIEKNFDNKEVMLKLVKDDGSLLYYASERLQADKEMVIEAIKSNSSAYFYAVPKLRMDEDVAEAFIKYGNIRDTTIILRMFSDNKKFVIKSIKYYVENNIDNVDKILAHCVKEQQCDSEILECIPENLRGKALRGCFYGSEKGDWLKKFLNRKTNLQKVSTEYFADEVFCVAVEYTGKDRLVQDLQEKGIDMEDMDDFMTTIGLQLHELVKYKHELALQNEKGVIDNSVEKKMEVFGS